jgi:hypothetical protein
MVSSVGGSLLSYLNNAPGADDGTTGNPLTGLGAQVGKKTAISQSALDRVAGSFKMSTQAKALEASQTALGNDLRAALSQAGVKLAGTVDFSMSSQGEVQIKGSDADQAAVKAFLKGDTSKPSFVSRIADQAKQAMNLSNSIQQGAAISQAARYSSDSSSMMSLYTSLMQNTGATTVVFSLSAGSSQLSYPGSLSAQG